MHRTALILAIVIASSGAADAKGGGRSSFSSGSPATPGQHWVQPYTTKGGVTVQGHYATNPNATTRDNWSTMGNVNPHTGRYGDKADVRPAGLVPISRY